MKKMKITVEVLEGLVELLIIVLKDVNRTVQLSRIKTQNKQGGISDPDQWRERLNEVYGTLIIKYFIEYHVRFLIRKIRALPFLYLIIAVKLLRGNSKVSNNMANSFKTILNKALSMYLNSLRKKRTFYKLTRKNKNLKPILQLRRQLLASYISALAKHNKDIQEILKNIEKLDELKVQYKANGQGKLLNELLNLTFLIITRLIYLSQSIDKEQLPEDQLNRFEELKKILWEVKLLRIKPIMEL